MSYVVKLTSKAHRQLKKLPDQTQDDFKEETASLSKNPNRYPFLSGKFSNLKKLEFNSDGLSYRAVFTVTKKTVLVVFLGTRENFYEDLRNYLD